MVENLALRQHSKLADGTYPPPRLQTKRRVAWLLGLELKGSRRWWRSCIRFNHEAEHNFRLSMEHAKDRATWILSLIHLGQTFADQNKKEEAQTTLAEIESALATLGVEATNNQDFLDLRQQIEGLK